MAQSSEPVLLDPMVRSRLGVQEPLMEVDVVAQVLHLLLAVRRAQMLERGRRLLLRLLLRHFRRPVKKVPGSAVSSPPSRECARVPRTPAGAGAGTLGSLPRLGAGAPLRLAPLSSDDREASEHL